MKYRVKMEFELSRLGVTEYQVEAKDEAEAIVKAKSEFWFQPIDELVEFSEPLGKVHPDMYRGDAPVATPIMTYRATATVFKPVAQTHDYQVTAADIEEAYSRATEELLNRLKQSGQPLKKVSYEIDVEEISDEVDEPEVED